MPTIESPFAFHVMRRILQVSALISFVVLAGCGGGGGGGGSVVVPQVVITASAAEIVQGGTVLFTANVAVNWTVQEGAAGGLITNVGVYTAPNKHGTFHVMATSQADPTKSAIAAVLVDAVGISLVQTAVTLAAADQFAFTANVTGTVNQAVTWAVQEGTSGGSITILGLYTAPGTLGTFHVIATSQADTTQKATATVTVTPLVVSVLPASDVLGPLGVRPFSATTNSSLPNLTFTWSVQEGAVGGAITSSGVYTAPNSTGSFHVVATSVQNPTKNGVATITAVASGFRPTSNMSTGRSAPTATLLPSGKVLLAGGDACFFFNYYGNCPLKSAEVYDAGAGTFATTGDMSVTRVFHTATLLNNGKVLVTGGHDASAELYDPTSGTFAATGSMSVGRNMHTATLLASGKVLIAGGQAFSGVLAAAELYDPNSGTFTATGTMLAQRTSHTATLLANGKVLIAGGTGSSGAELATTELYDPATGSFIAANSMVGPRTFHTATRLSNGNVLVTGGIGNRVSLSSAEVYDAVAGTFSATGAMTTARDSHFAILLANGAVLVAGASLASNSAFTAELYNTGSGTFTQTGSMEKGRALAAAVLLPDGRVLVAGGTDEISAEIYK